MPIIEIEVDRFTTIRKKVPRKVAEDAGGTKFYMPEYRQDLQRGPRQVNPHTHKIVEEQDSPTINVIPDDAETMPPSRRFSASQRVSSPHHRKVKMYKCKYCQGKSEDRDVIRKHIKTCPAK